MAGLLALSRGIDGFNERISHIANFCVIVATLVSASNAGVRYISGQLPDGFREWLLRVGLLGNAPLEMQWYLFAAMVMLGAAYTLCRNEHVRVDLIYGNVSEETRQWIDLFGCIFFLIPMCIMMIYITAPWAYQSFYYGEMSTNAGGLIRWPVKVLLPIGFVLLLLQGISELIKTVAAMLGYQAGIVAYERPVQ